jgi:hypothetical protein
VAPAAHLPAERHSSVGEAVAAAAAALASELQQGNEPHPRRQPIG